MKHRKQWIAALLSAALTLCLFGCAGEKNSAEGSGELTVYTALPETEVAFYFDAFEEETGIVCHYVRLSAGEMLARAEAERENPQASVLFGGSSDHYIAAAEKGLLEPYQSPELSNVPERFRDSEGVWNPIYVGCVAFACNREWFEREGLAYPESWEDLLRPELKGEIVMAHPATSGTAYTILSTILQMKGESEGWAYLEALNQNIFQYTRSGSAAPNAVAMGEAAVALTFSHDGLQPTTEGYPVELSFPEDGTGYEVGAAALLKNGKAGEEENAKALIDWLCSEQGQNAYAENHTFRVPVNTKAAVAEGLVTLDEVRVIDYDAVEAAGMRDAYCEEFEEKIASAPRE